MALFRCSSGTGGSSSDGSFVAISEITIPANTGTIVIPTTKKAVAVIVRLYRKSGSSSEYFSKAASSESVSTNMSDLGLAALASEFNVTFANDSITLSRSSPISSSVTWYADGYIVYD